MSAPFDKHEASIFGSVWNLSRRLTGNHWPVPGGQRRPVDSAAMAARAKHPDELEPIADGLDVEELLQSIDAERARAAAKIQAMHKRKVVMADHARLHAMATPIQARARGMLSRKQQQRERSLPYKMRRASRELMDMTQSLFKPPEPAPPMAPSPPNSTPQLRTLPLKTPTPTAASFQPRDSLCSCSCLSRAGRAGSSAPFVLPWQSSNSSSNAFDTPILTRLLTQHRFKWSSGLDSTPGRPRGCLNPRGAALRVH